MIDFLKVGFVDFFQYLDGCIPGTIDEIQDWKVKSLFDFLDSESNRMLYFLLFVMKITFGFDSSSESKISIFAAKVNSILGSNFPLHYVKEFICLK